MVDDRRADVLRSIAANVRRRRDHLGLTQAALAERADVDLRAIQRVEDGRINFGVVLLVLVADALGTSTSRLLQRRDLVRRSRGRPAPRHPRTPA